MKNHPVRNRLDFVTKLVLVLTMFCFGAPTLFAASFTDVPADNPYYVAVESLKNLGVVKGYGDGTFRPDQLVNRAEALKMILLSAKIKVDPGLYQTGFPDVKLSDWFSGYVFNAQNLHIVVGNPDGTFAPVRNVNKVEFLKMSIQAFVVDLNNYKNVQTPLAADVTNIGDWFVPYLNYAKSVDIIAPTIDDKLEPARSLTRGECSEILYKMYILKNGGVTQELLSTAEAKLVDSMISIKAGNVQDALSRAQEAVFYTDNALTQDPNSNITQGASLIARGFQKLYEASAAKLQNDQVQLKALSAEAKSDADQAVAKDGSLQDLSAKLKTLADSL